MLRATTSNFRAGNHGWSNNRRQWLNNLRRGGRPNRFLVPHELWHDEYFTKGFMNTLEQVNLNVYPQHNTLRNYLQLSRSDPLAPGFIRQKGATPKLEFPHEALRDRYGGKVFFHKRNRDQILLDPTSIPLYNKLPAAYKHELEEVPSDEYLYSNQWHYKMPKKQHHKINRNGYQRKSYEPESMMPERRPQYSGTWVQSNHADGVPMKKDLLPIRYTFPAEAHLGLWGGVGVLQGERYARGYKLNRRYKKEWRPMIKRKFFYMDLANHGVGMKLDITPRALELIEQAGGIDDYILGTPPCELNSTLGCMLKRDMLRTLNLLDKNLNDPFEPNADELVVEEPGFINKSRLLDNHKVAEAMYKKYEKYQRPEKEIEWIGLPLQIALKKQYDIEVNELGTYRYSKGLPLKDYHKQQDHNTMLLTTT